MMDHVNARRRRVGKLKIGYYSRAGTVVFENKLYSCNL
jgi:hypothetical protein